MNWKILATTAAVLFLSACGDDDNPIQPVNTNLDASFGVNGQVTTTMGSEQSKIQRILIDSQDRIYAVGYYGNSGDSLAIARYSADGDLDTTFATQGKFVTDFAGAKFNTTDAEFDAAGRIIISGITGNGIDMGIAAVSADGVIDLSFDGDGLASVDVATILGNTAFSNDYALGVGISDISGAIYLGGRSNGDNGSAEQNTTVVKLDANGALDGAYGTGGVGFLDLVTGNSEYLLDLAEIDDAPLVAGAVSNGTDMDFMIARISSTATAYTGFGSNGVITIDFDSGDDWAQKLLITDSETSAIAIGLSTTSGTSGAASDVDLEMVKFDVTTGDLVTTFGTNGKTTFGLNYNGTIPDSSKILDATIDTNGNIVVVSYNGIDTAGAIAVIRFTADGNLDTSFGSNGVLGVPVDYDVGTAKAIGMQSTGKIVVGEQKGANNDRHFHLVRFKYNP